MNLGERIDAYRRAFARGPLGEWSTAQGSFGVMMSERWELSPDGTGKITSHSAFSGTSVDLFRWRSVGDFRIEVDFLGDPDEPPDPEDGPDEEHWILVEYEFVIVEHDVGREVVMRQVDKPGFWMSDAPLRPLGFDRA